MVENWVGMCKQMGGRWPPKWKDPTFAVEVTMCDSKSIAVGSRSSIAEAEKPGKKVEEEEMRWT